MARSWKQYDIASSSWIDWPAGTLPSPDSLFRAAFLNQFVGWIKYANNYNLGVNVGVTPNYVASGDVIQTAAFWNSLNYDPPYAKHYTDQKSADVVSGYEYDDVELTTTAAYAATLFDPVSVGSIIHPREASDCQMRNMMLKLRTRLDMMQVTKSFNPPRTGYSATVNIYHSTDAGWAQMPATTDPESHWQDYYTDDYPFYGWKQGYCKYYSSVRLHRFEYISSNSVHISAPHKAAWRRVSIMWQWWNETPPPLVPQTKANRIEGSAIEIPESGHNFGSIGYATMSARDHGPYTMLVAAAYDPIAILLDELPAVFKPAEYPFPL